MIRERKVAFICILITCFLTSVAQKKIIDSAAAVDWPEVVFAGASPNGQFGFFSHKCGQRNFLTVKSIREGWHHTFSSAYNAVDCLNNSHLIILGGKDTVRIFDYKKRQIVLTDVGVQVQAGLACVGVKKLYYACWIADRGQQSELVVWVANTGTIRRFKSVVSALSQNGKVVFVRNEGINRFSIVSFGVASETESIVWIGSGQPDRLMLNNVSSKLAFMVPQPEMKGVENIYVADIYKRRIFDVNASFSRNIPQAGPSYLIKFTSDDERLLFAVDVTCSSITGSEIYPIAVDVWHYKDRFLQSEQIKGTNLIFKNQYAAFNITDSSSIILNSGYDEFIEPSDQRIGNRYVVILKDEQQANGRQIDPRDNFKSSVVVLDMKDGKRTQITTPGYYKSVCLSPRGKYVLYFDQIAKQFKSYAIESKRTIDISSAIGFSVCNALREDQGNLLAFPASEPTWHVEDSSVLICDQRDIWKLDPSGRSIPECITLGIGRKNNASVTFVIQNNINNTYANSVNNLLVKILDIETYKESTMTILQLRTNSPRISGLEAFRVSQIDIFKDFFLIKGGNGNTPENWYLSKDFSSRIALSHVEVSKKYRTYRKLLINYNLVTGGVSKALLYLPEDFDSSKKYPVIFNIHEIFSDKFLDYQPPELSRSTIDPAWMCSRGYVVLQPDIYYKRGFPGESAFACVSAALDKIKQYRWVDMDHLGISGASHGAFSINYILTKTNAFAAAASANGMVDLIAGYSLLRGNGDSRQWVYESGQGGIGKNLWEDKQTYINNSPIINADKVNTPVLILHNYEDGAVPWSQGLEWFMALRRLGKKVWMLQYKGEGHGVFEKANQSDYTQRLDQFFNFYLRDEYPPKWMTRGISANKKGKISGLDFDLIAKP
jgi:dipeptidyl aminopeptidase/acylaminoacyl peptidase